VNNFTCIKDFPASTVKYLLDEEYTGKSSPRVFGNTIFLVNFFDRFRGVFYTGGSLTNRVKRKKGNFKKSVPKPTERIR
jgi:hypothetical protein